MLCNDSSPAIGIRRVGQVSFLLGFLAKTGILRGVLMVKRGGLTVAFRDRKHVTDSGFIF
jgi:hypothetical protein